MASYVSTVTDWEGFPLAIRACPLNADDPIWSSNPHLAFLEHQLAEVKDNGLPEKDYNDRLADFDHEVHQAFESGSGGQVIVVETFGGKRTYYACTESVDAATEILNGIVNKFPQHRLSPGTNADHSWKFYLQYRERFEW